MPKVIKLENNASYYDGMVLDVIEHIFDKQKEELFEKLAEEVEDNRLYAVQFIRKNEQTAETFGGNGHMHRVKASLIVQKMDDHTIIKSMI